MRITNKIYERMKEIIKDNGNILLNASDDLGIQSKKGNNNIVTKYDILIQKKLEKELLELIPGSAFIGEEDDFHEEKDSEYVFIVDPIDGTTNFSRNMSLSSISIALLHNNKPIIALCYNPYLDELYEARKNKGAYLNGNPIHVSNKKLKNGILLSGCAPYYDHLREESLEIQKKFAFVASDFRRFGSAVIEICSIASGRAEMYFELRLMPWDYAAAGLILEEAGGKITTITGKKVQYKNPSSIIAHNNIEDYLKYIK